MDKIPFKNDTKCINYTCHMSNIPIPSKKKIMHMICWVTNKQLTGQTSTSPFMNIRDGTERKVSFNTRNELGDKIDKLTVVMSRLAAKDSH